MKKYNILFVCLGNICRSPMAEGVFKYMVINSKREELFGLDSAGTGAYHIGSNPDPRAIETCLAKGIKLSHKARQVKSADFETFDYVVAMDKSNYAHLKNMHSGSRLLLMRDFDLEAGPNDKDVPDPYYGGQEGFEKEVYDILLRSSKQLLDFVMKEK